MLKKIKKILVIIIILVIACILARYFIFREHVIKLIVVNVQEKSLKTIDNANTRYIVRLKKQDDNVYKEGQEIYVYFDGIVATGSPMEINADRIEIISEKTNKEIPEEIYRYYNFSLKNISVKIESFSSEKMEFIINDENKYPLEYGEDFSFIILKKNLENEEHNQNLEFDYDSYTPPTETSTSSYSPNPNRLKNEWEELKIIGEENNLIYKWEDVSEECLKLKGICDWTEIYGKLNEGEYELRIHRKTSENDSFFKNINVKFKVNDFGNIDYEEPEFGWYKVN